MIRQETDRRAVHVAQVLQMAMQEGAAGPQGRLPETRYAAVDPTPAVPAGVLAAAACGAAGLWWALNRRHARS